MKKILMVCESFEGGVYAYVSQLCNDLADEFEIYLAIAYRSRTPKDFMKKIDKRITVIYTKYLSKKYIKNPVKIIKSIRELREIEKLVKPDIIHLHSTIAGAVGRLAYSLRRNVVIYTPHGYAHILLGSGPSSFVYEFVERLLGNRAITLTCCESEDEEAKKFSKKTAYIETGININDFDEQISSVDNCQNSKKRFTVFTLGRACKQKQPSLFNEIAKLVPEADFLWVGNGELEYELNASNLTVIGWKERFEALAIAKEADAFILCSLGEAIAMSLLENMYLRKLVLVSNTIGNKSVIKNGYNGYVCSNPDEYASMIKNAIAYFPTNIAANAHYDVVKKYNSVVMCEKYIEFYTSV